MRILFITATRIGDAVLQTGLLNHLIQQNPNACITVACGPVAAPLFEGVPGLEKLIILHKKPYSLHWLGMWGRCVGYVWDWVIDLRNAPLSYLLFAKNQKHLGKANRDEDEDHRVIRFARVLDLADNPPAPKLWTKQINEDTAEKLIPDDGRPVLAIGPTANWGPKRWLPENFVTLADRLTSDGGIFPGGRIAVFGAESERHLAEPVLNELGPARVINLVGKGDLLDVFACLKRADFYVGNDSGLTHMAAVANIPVLALFGPTKPHLYRPWGKHTAVATTGIPFLDHFKTGNEWLEEKSLMELLTVERAEKAARALWEKVEGEEALL